MIVDHVDHAVSADHTGQVDPADCGGLADFANSILMFVSCPVVLIFRLVCCWCLLTVLVFECRQAVHLQATQSPPIN